jgi:hypothetical protein
VQFLEYSLHSGCLSAVWRGCISPKQKLVFRNVADVLFYISPLQSIILSIYFVSCSLFHRGAVSENKEIPVARQSSLLGQQWLRATLHSVGLLCAVACELLSMEIMCSGVRDISLQTRAVACELLCVWITFSGMRAHSHTDNLYYFSRLKTKANPCSGPTKKPCMSGCESHVWNMCMNN